MPYLQSCEKRHTGEVSYLNLPRVVSEAKQLREHENGKAPALIRASKFIAVIAYGQTSLPQHHLLVLKYVSVVAKDVFAKRRQETGSTDSGKHCRPVQPKPPGTPKIQL
jgi:hypothetical protein